MKFVDRFLNYLSFGEKWAGGICFLLLTLLMIADVAKREVVDKFLSMVIEGLEAYPSTSVASLLGGWSVYLAEWFGQEASSFLEWIGRGGIVWAQKLSLYFMLWGGLFGSALASAKGSHLRPEIADKLLPKKVLPYVKVIEQFVISTFFLFLTYLSFLYVQESISLDEVNPVTEISLWKVQLIFPYVFFSMGFRHLVYGIFPKLIPADLNEATEALEEMKGEFPMDDQGAVNK
ncbi:TRAP-type C4-dicarboxylate transport system small permease protein [Leptospira ryugenii]|uniref:TRAP-type C4-dicarboxylate transport system small permease protein n=1 Tax=Leptospira ryugenii TaxID=1917863 RepID=A0A2P2DXM7_9LEPT|nr:TRAP transporter small permease [Leptospira ryugenii]GBF49356.1 TRAP-type C4-dicarboxylate transport system small permease protein [Leptospira ryugenii]